MIVYDVTNLESYQNIQKWVTEVRSLTEPETELILIGNKSDLCETEPNKRSLNKEDAERFACDNKMLFMESSAEACNNVRESFEVLLQKIYSESKDNKDNGISLVKPFYNKPNQEAKCC